MVDSNLLIIKYSLAATKTIQHISQIRNPFAFTKYYTKPLTKNFDSVVHASSNSS